MTPYIIMAIIVVGMGFNAWLVLRWEDQDRARRREQGQNPRREEGR